MNRSSNTHADSLVSGLPLLFRIAVGLAVLAGLAIWAWGLPGTNPEAARQRPETVYVPYLFVAYAYGVSLTFVFGLISVFRLLAFLEQKAPALTAGALRHVKIAAVALCGLFLGGIAGLMFLAAGKGEDITGIVAPALLMTLLSAVVATVAAVYQKRAQLAASRHPSA